MNYKFILLLVFVLAFFLRVWKIDSAPPSLYWDEMDAGYQAYSILKTGRDYFGNHPGFVVQSFADYRAPFLIYATVPFIAVLGLNIISVRLPAALFGTASVFLIYLLSKHLFKSEKISLGAALLAAFAPWSIQYGRMAFEGVFLLTLFLGGIIAFLKGMKNSRWFIASGVLFGVSMFSYNTAKLFVPLIFISLWVVFLRNKKSERNFLIGVFILAAFFVAGLTSSFFSGGGMRFSEIAVWTDPQLESSINQSRLESASAYGGNLDAGAATRLADKLTYNKPAFVLDKMTRNYFQSLSPEFLFISGDPNQRHSPFKMGELYRAEFLTVLLGIFALIALAAKKDKTGLFLLIWMVLAPLPASLTREGGAHASRLFLLFPALTIASSVGFFYLLGFIKGTTKKVVAVLFLGFWAFNVLFFLNYYFGSYTIESAKFFQYGFAEAAKTAIRHKSTYDYVIIDDRKDSALMNYLFESSYEPGSFQKASKSLDAVLGDFKSRKLDNVHFMMPGRRDWPEVFEGDLLGGNYLLIISAEQMEEQTVDKLPSKLTENQKLLDVIYYKNGDPAFYVIESKADVSL